jgi:DNA-binding XRE family transcriptional regulator
MVGVAKRKRKKPTAWALKLKALRDKLGITQAEAARRADVSVRTWIAWENSQRSPSRFTAPLIRAAFPDEKL